MAVMGSTSAAGTADHKRLCRRFTQISADPNQKTWPLINTDDMIGLGRLVSPAGLRI